MEEVIFRRYKRLLEEDSPLPQLIVIDGGKGQLSSALKSLDILGLRGKISILVLLNVWKKYISQMILSLCIWIKNLKP